MISAEATESAGSEFRVGTVATWEANMSQRTYSIDDLENCVEEFQHESPRRIADALKVLGIPMYHRGIAADLTGWYPKSDQEVDPKAPKIAVRGLGWDPDPELVLVSRDNLPVEWLRQLEEDADEGLERDGWEFDPASPTYPKELDIAMLAWRDVSQRPNVLNVKEALRSAIRTYGPDLSEDAIARIATVCNWSKKGGRPSRGS